MQDMNLLICKQREQETGNEVALLNALRSSAFKNKLKH